jgi:acyl dehydratase
VTTSATGRGVPTVGEQLPTVSLMLTLQRLVMEAAANRDFAPIHFDGDAAHDSGAPAPYMNTTFIETVFEALLRNWAGLAARIEMIEFSMKAFNCVGDEITAGGCVAATTEREAQLVAELDLWVDGPRGRTVTGGAAVAFPR